MAINSAARTLKLITQNLRIGTLTSLRFPSQQYPVICCHVNQNHRQISLSSHCLTKKNLSHSSLMIQDGLEMKELPLITKRIDLIAEGMYSAEEIKNISKQDEYFRNQFEGCETVKDVMTKLHVPADKITGYSSAFALQKISQLKESRKDGLEFDTFVSTAIVNELYDTVIREVSSLSNETVISLLSCFLKSNSFQKECGKVILNEIESRIGYGTLEIEELCLISSLVINKVEQNYLDNIWTHIANRYKELNENNIRDVFVSFKKAFKYNNETNRKLLDVFVLQLKEVLWKLNESDVGDIVQVMLENKVRNDRLYSLFCVWLGVNVHNVSQGTLRTILAAFCFAPYHHHFTANNLLPVLEKYVCAKKEKLQFKTLAYVMEFCRYSKIWSPVIMNETMQILMKKGFVEPLDTSDMFLILRTFGHLNFIPENDAEFISLVEHLLKENFCKLDFEHMLDLMTALSYIGMVPLNQKRRSEMLPGIEKLKGNVAAYISRSKTSTTSDDDPSFEVYVRYLPSDMSREELVDALEDYKPSKVILRPAEYLTKSALITCKDEEVAKKMIKDLHCLKIGDHYLIATQWKSSLLNDGEFMKTSGMLHKVETINMTSVLDLNGSKQFLIPHSDMLEKYEQLFKEKWMRLNRTVNHVLTPVLWRNMYDWRYYVYVKPYIVDFVLKRLLNTTTQSNDLDSKECQQVAILVQFSDYYCNNMKHLMGEHAQKKRHLMKLGYNVVELQYSILKNLWPDKKRMENYVEFELQKCVNLKKS